MVPKIVFDLSDKNLLAINIDPAQSNTAIKIGAKCSIVYASNEESLIEKRANMLIHRLLWLTFIF